MHACCSTGSPRLPINWKPRPTNQLATRPSAPAAPHTPLVIKTSRPGHRNLLCESQKSGRLPPMHLPPDACMQLPPDACMQTHRFILVFFTIILQSKIQLKNGFHHKVPDIFMHNLRSIMNIFLKKFSHKFAEA